MHLFASKATIHCPLWFTLMEKTLDRMLWLIFGSFFNTGNTDRDTQVASGGATFARKAVVPDAIEALQWCAMVSPRTGRQEIARFSVSRKGDLAAESWPPILKGVGPEG